MPPENITKNKVLIVGCGDLGSAIATQLAQLNLQVTGVKRHIASLDNVTIIQADVTEPSSLSPLNKIQPEILIYCVAADGQTDAQYKAQYVDGFRHVLNTQSSNSHLKHVFFISSTRVYGQLKEDKIDGLLDEADITMPNDFGGERLLEAERLLKPFVDHVAQACAYTLLRLTGIYGSGRWRMFDLVKNPESMSKENRWTNRIHRDDAVAFIVFLVQEVLAANLIKNCYIVTDSSPSAQHDVLRWIAEKMQMNSCVDIKSPKETLIKSKLPPPQAGEGWGEGEKSSTYPSPQPSPTRGEGVNQHLSKPSGRRFSNQAMRATGFNLQYPDYQTGYQALLPEYLKTQPHINLD